MQNGFKSNHFNDANGNPAGGITHGTGFTIAWQNGPLGRGEERREPNGAFVEDIIVAAMDRLHWYQSSKFACAENAAAIVLLADALARLSSRTQSREVRQVEGTHQP